MNENYKVICFVHNELNKISGLYHAFDNLNPVCNLFISTYIYNIINENVTPKFGQGNSTLMKFLLITKDSQPDLKQSISIDDKWDILLVSHDVNINDFPNGFFTKDMLVMVHQNQDNYNEIDNLQTVRKVKPGQHEPLENQGYNLLLGIVNAWDNGANPQKFKSSDYDAAKQKLIKWFGLNEKLNKALGFLHNSLGGTPGNINILTEGVEKFTLEVKFKKKDIEKTLEKWIEGLNGKTGDEYNKALTDVRDALLEQAGVAGEN